MFSKKNLVDVKKSTVKLQDPKKELATRIKHLKIILDNVDIIEAKSLFESNFSHIYNILYDSFVQAENNLRQKELSFHLVHKAHKEELECSLWILEQILCLLPELIHKRWQLHSLGRLLSKLLHHGNAIKLRKQAIRYFIMWYQALNDNAPDYVHQIFATLVPGFNGNASAALLAVQTGGSVFHDNSAQQPVTPTELQPILPPSSGEKTPEYPSKYYLEALLEYMVHTVVKLEWQDKSFQRHLCFNFLLESFKMYYLPKICPNFCQETSLYKPNLDLPYLRKLEHESEFVHCRVTLILWLANYMHQSRQKQTEQQHQQQQQQLLNQNNNDDENQLHDSTHTSLDSTMSIQQKTATDEDLAVQIVRDVLCSSRDNVNFLHELYRQAFLLNFQHVNAIRKIISVYKDLIQGNQVGDLPSYAMEPPEDTPRTDDLQVMEAKRLRNDSYLGAIQYNKENLLIRAGIQNVYQLFMTHAANVFMLESNNNQQQQQQMPRMLEEQTDSCKRVLNIYRYMVMNTRMDSSTWEQLLLVLLQITSLVLGEQPPKRKQYTLGGKLAPAIFQTLIVTWIKANLNVMIQRELWDRFLNVLTSLTNWEELIKEWAKTLETLTRVLARQVYNLDLNDLPLDRLAEQKSKRGRKPASTSISRPESTNQTQQMKNNRQDSVLPSQNNRKIRLVRSFSDGALIKRNKKRIKFLRQCKSMDLLLNHDTESTDRTRSPSPAPSSGMESNSIKDSPIQLDVIDNNQNSLMESQQDVLENRGVVCGGMVRGWLPDVAVILWRRMLGALGDINTIQDAKLHAQVFDYLIKLTDTLIKIKQNQGVCVDNVIPPSSELIPPITLIIPWCFGALMLPDGYEAGKLNSLRLLCTITLNCDVKYRSYLAHFYRFIHSALTGPLKPPLNITLKHLGPRFLSLQLPGSTLLLLDLVHACNVTLNNNELLETSPRTEAVQILANLLSVPDDLSSISVLRPEQYINVISCPDIKEHVVSILLRAGRREPTGKARCIALSALGMFVYKELVNRTFHPKISEAINVILLALKFNKKVIAQLSSNILFLLCDHAVLLWNQYPHLGSSIIRTLCSALFLHAPLNSAMASESDKALGTALLLCLGEWCMKLGPKCLLETIEYGENGNTCLLLQVFTVLHKIIIGKASVENPGGLTQPSINDDFDPNILSDDLDKSLTSKMSGHCQTALTLCAKTILSHLVTHLGHFPMAIGAARLSSLVVEHDDVPNMNNDDLSTNIFHAPNIQLFILTRNVISSLIELPALDLPGGGVTAGLATANRQVRVLLRDLSGKSCWDASILYRKPCVSDDTEHNIKTQQQQQQICSNFVQPESIMLTNNLPQRAMRHRPPNVLPEVGNAAPDLDQLDDLLQYLGHTSPECLEDPNRKLNVPALAPIPLDLEQEAIATVISQRNIELEENRYVQHMDSMLSQPIARPNSRAESNQSLEVESNAFQQCRLLFSQLGLTGWEHREQLHLLNKTERLLRELRNLDGQSCRETHKVAVIYVAPGQEDKTSILSNQGGSAAYEQFLAALAWEIELEGHTGFLGGLQRQGSTGLTAPYVATSLLESIFHVATRMPSDSPEAVLSKTRHLGNDEVHIVWSEHARDYRRDIIPTEFCDILIVIYPLGNNLNRITVNCKADVPHFGVLFNEAIVESNILAGLVRATAICASRAKRITYQHYQQYYEERARSLDTVITKHINNSTYEEFIAKVYSPLTTVSPFLSGGSVQPLQDGAPSNLAAALLDSHSKTSNRIDQKLRASANEQSRGVWFNNSDNVESSISPRPLKKLSTNLKNSRRSLRHEASVESPPESPQQIIKRK